jgi:hypothetical protein
MPKENRKGGWSSGIGVILIGCCFLVGGIVARLQGLQYVIELVDGIVIAVLCFAVGSVMLWRRARDARNRESQGGGPST